MVYLALFFAALFLINGIPHFVQGVCGNRFQTPFAKPFGSGESSGVINVLWGSFNFAVGYGLLCYAGDVEIGNNTETLVLLSGALLMALFLAWIFNRVRNT